MRQDASLIRFYRHPHVYFVSRFARITFHVLRILFHPLPHDADAFPRRKSPGTPLLVQREIRIVLQRLLTERGVPLADLKTFLATEVKLVPQLPVVGRLRKKVSVLRP